MNNIVDSKEVVCAVKGSSFAEMGVPALLISVSSDGIFRGVRVLNIQVGQDESRESSQNESTNEDGLGQGIT